MSALLARIPAGSVVGFLSGLLATALASLAAMLGLPDLGRLKEILERIQEILALGGMALATGISLLFILAWVISHLRKPKKDAKPHLAMVALGSSYVPVALTAVAAIGVFIPLLTPYMLKAFAIAVLVAAITWCISVAAVVVGGRDEDLKRARKALLMAGTPWYCLAVWLSTFL